MCFSVLSLCSDTFTSRQNRDSDEQIAGNVKEEFERGSFTLDMWS